ncbi:hypothetical protein GCM10010211_49050 [Streptomyces albospinus]|uniref:Uncharacterized protein n=2 Tax=Streptomyces TaxID=1883 RepID=A0A101PBM5_9ACTN|nr:MULTISPECIES: hypothetical protein [Streptomyces]KUN08575.1 hypothetical protein AQI95_09475 [Streptomyces yokosukanensis]GGU77320.1 hypothetical protein GCM10010211_49050 [Streptomyces albospinus]
MAHDGLSVEVSVPFGADTEDPTIRLSGPEGAVREAIGSSFRFDSDTLTNATLAELIIEASRMARSASQIVHGLGASVVPSQPDSQASTPRPAAQPPMPEQSGAKALLEQIDSCRTIDELKRLWAENQAAFSDSSVMDAWKARGRVLAGS